MWGRTLRTETLDRSNARDLEQVVQNPSQCEGFGTSALLKMSKGFYIEHLEMNFQHFWLFISESGRQSCEPEFNYRMWDIALRNGTLDRNAGRDSERVVRTFRETHAISAMASSTSQDVRHRSPQQNNRHYNGLALRVRFYFIFIKNQLAKNHYLEYC